jgi:hypothetical protein
MDPKQITSLARLLKNNGDKVLNSEFQLSLSGNLIIIIPQKKGAAFTHQNKIYFKVLFYAP